MSGTALAGFCRARVEEMAGSPLRPGGELDAMLARLRRTLARHEDCGTGTGYCDDGGHGWDWAGSGGGCADLADLASAWAGHADCPAAVREFAREWQPPP